MLQCYWSSACQCFIVTCWFEHFCERAAVVGGIQQGDGEKNINR